MYADGCVLDAKGRQKQIVINLHEDDRILLDKFKNELDYSGELHYYDYKGRLTKKGYKMANLYRLTVSSDKLCDSLIRLGCTPRKTFTLRFPNESQVPSEFMPHFIRGVMDGDGYICRRVFSPLSCCFIFGIVGTLDLCNGIRLLLHKDLGLSITKKLRKMESIWGVYYSARNDIIKLYNYLYKDAEIFLPRKHDIFKQAL